MMAMLFFVRLAMVYKNCGFTFSLNDFVYAINDDQILIEALSQIENIIFFKM